MPAKEEEKVKDKEKRFAEDFLEKWKKGVSKLEFSKYEKILKKQEELLKKDPNNPKIWFGRGSILFEMGLYSEALKCFEVVIKLDPTHKEVWNAKANTLSILGSHHEAAECYKKAFELASTQIDRKYRKMLTEEKVVEDILKDLMEDEKQEKYLKELESYEQRLNLNPKDTEAWYSKADVQYKMGNYREALFSLFELTKLDEKYPNLWKTKGDLYRLLGDEKKAEICYKRAQEFIPEKFACPLCDTIVSADDTVCPVCNIEFAPEEEVEVKPAVPKSEEPLPHLEPEEELPPPEVPEPKPSPPKPEEPVPKPAPPEPPTPLPKPPKLREKGLVREKGIGAREGRINGLINGVRPGKVNGLINGTRMGRVNGLINGMGRINGLLHGIRTGRINGLVNGFRSTREGLTNGLTNGIGVTNGLGFPRFRRENLRRRWKIYMIPLITAVLLLTPFVSLIEPEVTYRIEIDGEFDDWTGLTTAIPVSVQLNPNIDIVNVGLEDNDDYLSFYIETEEPILEGGARGVDTFFIFIDNDLDYDTGYRINHLGSDHLVSIYGKQGKVLSSTLKTFDNHRDNDDWNGWYPSGHVESVLRDNRLEGQVKWDALRDFDRYAEAFFYSQSCDKEEDLADYNVGTDKGVLRIMEKSLAQEVMDSDNERILQIDLEALETDIAITGMTLEMLGTASSSDVDSVKIIADGSIFEEPYSSTKRVEFAFESTITIHKGETKELFVEVDVHGSSGRTLGASIQHPRDVRVDNGIVSLRRLPSERGVGYVGIVPTETRIDGGFSDWSNPKTDTDNTVISNPDIDIKEYNITTDDNSAFFYMSVAGTLSNGTIVPYWNEATGEVPPSGPPDSDRDTMSDEIDPQVFDFNNNDKADELTGNDVDEDGLVDYPFGEDYWLNTTIPDLETFPEDYRGMFVSIYIGPIVKPAVLGYDTAAILIDSKPGGFTNPSLSFGLGLDYMLAFSGKNSNLKEKSLLEWTGNDEFHWDWTLIGEPNVKYDSRHLETEVSLSTLGINPAVDTFNVLFYINNYDNTTVDLSNEYLEGPTKAYVSEGNKGEFDGYDSLYHYRYDAYFNNEIKNEPIRFETRHDEFIQWYIPESVRLESEDSAEVIGELKYSDLEIDLVRAYYDDIYTNSKISLEYLFEETRLRENIVIQERIPLQEWSHEWEYLVLDIPIEFSDELGINVGAIIDKNDISIELETSDDIDFHSGAKTIFSIEAPIAIDAKEDIMKCQYVLSTEDTNSLALRCPFDWLETAAYPVRIDPTIYYLESDDYINGWDIFGTSVTVGDVNGDDYADMIVGAPYNDQDYTDGGRVYIYLGPISSDDSSPDVMLAFAGANYDKYGGSLAVGNFNDDCCDDIVVAPPDQINNDVHIKYGATDLSGTYTSPDVTVPYIADTSQFGKALATGNLNGDSYDDLLIGASMVGTNNGEVYIYYYDSTDWGDGTVNDNPDDTLQSASTSGVGYLFGFSITMGNFYSGSLDDIAVGEPNYDPVGDIFDPHWIGRVNLFDGDLIDDNGANPDGPTNYIDNPQGMGSGAGDNDMFAFSVTSGDFNPDSTTYDFDDLVVGEPRNDESAADAGRVYIFTCDDDPGGWQTDNTVPTDIANPEASNGGNDQFGFDVWAGDYYGDSVTDFFIGAPYSDNGGTENGALYIYDCDGSTIPTSYTNIENGSSGGERLGWSIRGGKYGYDDNYILIAGAPYWDDNNPSYVNAGRAWVIIVPEYLSIITPIISIVLPLIVLRRRKSRITTRRD